MKPHEEVKIKPLYAVGNIVATNNESYGKIIRINAEVVWSSAKGTVSVHYKLASGGSTYYVKESDIIRQLA